MKNNKFGLVLIVLLLIAFIPATIYGIYYGALLEKEDGNPKHLPYKDGKLYYYDNGTLKASYVCESQDCKNAISKAEDAKYFDTVFNGTEVGDTGKYIFIDDGGVIKMVMANGVNSTSQINLKSIKNYDGRIGKYLIIISDGDAGYKLFDTETGSMLLNDYEYIGVNRSFDTNNFIAKKGGQYTIITPTGENTSNPSSLRITDYNDSYIMFYNDNAEYYTLATRNNAKRVENIISYKATDAFTVVKTASGVTVYTPDLETELDSKSGDITFSVEGQIVKYYDSEKNIGQYVTPGAEEENQTDNQEETKQPEEVKYSEADQNNPNPENNVDYQTPTTGDGDTPNLDEIPNISDSN